MYSSGSMLRRLLLLARRIVDSPESSGDEDYNTQNPVKILLHFILLAQSFAPASLPIYF
jgi:hypothetical protein